MSQPSSLLNPRSLLGTELEGLVSFEIPLVFPRSILSVRVGWQSVLSTEENTGGSDAPVEWSFCWRKMKSSIRVQKMEWNTRCGLGIHFFNNQNEIYRKYNNLRCEPVRESRLRGGQSINHAFSDKWLTGAATGMTTLTIEIAGSIECKWYWDTD